jgi:hypothetical protein
MVGASFRSSARDGKKLPFITPIFFVKASSAPFISDWINTCVREKSPIRAGTKAMPAFNCIIPKV